MKYHDIDDRHFCQVYGCAERAEKHHIISRGSGGPDDEWNILWLCAFHHRMRPDSFHRLGRSSFAAAYPQFADKIAAACERAGRVMKSATSSTRSTK
jgi:hypothetical protein